MGKSNLLSKYGYTAHIDISCLARVDNMFSYGDKAPHTTRRRVLGNVYAKSTLHSSENLPRYATQLIKRQLLPFIYWRESRGESVDAISLFLDFATDFITSYIFGSGNTADFLGKERMPLICNNCAELDEAPERVRKGEGDARHSTEGVALTLMNNLENLRDHAPGQNATSTEPVVLKRLSQNLFAQIDTTKCPGPSNLKFTIASELQDHIIAGTESSGWTMTYIIHELSKRSGLQDKLREEICSLTELDLKNTLSFSPTTVQTLDKLPLLDAIILETMRVYPGIAGSQPRLVPQSSSTFTVLGHLIPPGTVLSAQAYSLHRNAEVFPSPETWDPYRWIEVDSNKRNEMQRWFWAFGSGPRMCIGNFFAMIGMYCCIRAGLPVSTSLLTFTYSLRIEVSHCIDIF